MLKIQFSKVLHHAGYMPYELDTFDPRIKRERFNTLKELKAYFQITTPLKVVGSTFAIGGNGARYDFKVYEAEVPGLTPLNEA